MKTRILTALAGIPALLLLLFWPGGIPWLVAVGILMALAVWEYTAALQKGGIWIHWVALVAYGAAMLYTASARAATGLPAAQRVSAFLVEWRPLDGQVGPGLMIAVLLAGDLIWKRRGPIRNVGATVLGVCYIGALFPFLVLLRGFPVDDFARRAPMGEAGAWVVLTVLAVIWAGDSAAYFGGRAWGRRKCAPAISPNKTWEGVFCGLAASAVMGALAWGLALPLNVPDADRWVFGVAFGLLVGAAGQIGDLVESAMKREIGVKDFGTLLPGHGGVLDRFDSLLFAAPTAYAMLAYALPHLWPSA
jgi:phosphatidate cytidylyltransferase